MSQSIQPNSAVTCCPSGWPGHLRLPKHPSRPKVKHSEEVWGDSVETTAPQVLLIWSATFEMWFPSQLDVAQMQKITKKDSQDLFLAASADEGGLMSRQVASFLLLPFAWHRWVIDTPPQKWKLPICKKAWISTISLLTLLLPLFPVRFLKSADQKTLSFRTCPGSALHRLM